MCKRFSVVVFDASFYACQSMCVCVCVCGPACVALLLESGSRPTEEGRRMNGDLPYARYGPACQFAGGYWQVVGRLNP